MLGDLYVFGVEFKSMSKGGAFACRIAAQPVLGRGLYQRRYRVTEGKIGRQRVVGIGGVKLGRLPIVAHRLFKPLLFEELAGLKVELGCAPAVIAARRFGRLGVFGWSGGRHGALAVRRGKRR